jgi:hypothetical protein
LGFNAAQKNIPFDDRVVKTHNASDPEAPLDVDTGQTFKNGVYTEKVTQSPTTLYRAGNADRWGGRFWAREMPTSSEEAIQKSALNPDWGNKASHVATIEFPARTTIYEGKVAVQTIADGTVLLGGGNQIMFSERVPESWLKSFRPI